MKMNAPFYGRPDVVRIKGDGDYASKLAEAKAIQPNAHVFGMQAAPEGEGPQMSSGDVSERIAGMQQGVQYLGLNDRQQTYQA